MKQITILSGKGGTGKTTLTAVFAALARRVVVADCDVGAPNLHMLLHPEIIEEQDFTGSKLAIIDETKCVKCGLCREKCRFNAINEDLKVDQFSCEGCGVCALACPMSAITLIERVTGRIYISRIKFGFMVHALLDPGKANSGKLVALVRGKAKALAEKENINILLIDGPPGIGYPAISSVAGVDIGLVIAEPTLSGIHDLESAIPTKTFRYSSFVCVNMYDINLNNTERIERLCEENNVEVIGRIPSDLKVTEAIVNGKTIIEHSPESGVAEEIKRTWKRILECADLYAEGLKH
ncbi:MAG: 4Fe-4S binding protein [Thermoproteota archaeon]